MGYRLKINIEEFQVVDGPFAGRRYRHGVEYADVPPGEEKKFEEIRSEQKAGPVAVDHHKYEKTKPATKAQKKKIETLGKG